MKGLAETRREQTSGNGPGDPEKRTAVAWLDRAKAALAKNDFKLFGNLCDAAKEAVHVGARD